MPTTLHPEIQALRERLKAAEPTLREISEATNLGWHWLRALAEGRIRSPGYEKVQALKQYLDQVESEKAA